MSVIAQVKDRLKVPPMAMTDNSGYRCGSQEATRGGQRSSAI